MNDYGKPWEKMTNRERKRIHTAVHECGHAIVAKYLGMRVDHIRLEPHPTIPSSGWVGAFLPGELDHEKACTLAVAGFVATALIMKGADEVNKESGQRDRKQALEYARAALLEKGGEPTETDVQAFMYACMRRAERILLDNLEEHKRLHLALLKHGSAKMKRVS